MESSKSNFTKAIVEIINLPVEAQVMQKIVEIDDYLRTVTT